jgi:hypothetical protein
MSRKISMTCFFAATLFTCAIAIAHAQSAKALLDQSAAAMGGMAALRTIKSQVIESEGKQFDSSSTPTPLGLTRQISTFGYIYLPAEKIVIEADHISPRNGQVRTAPLVIEFITALDKLNLDVGTIVGIHGDSATIQAARAAAQGGK